MVLLFCICLQIIKPIVKAIERQKQVVCLLKNMHLRYGVQLPLRYGVQVSLSP